VPFQFVRVETCDVGSEGLADRALWDVGHACWRYVGIRCRSCDIKLPSS
jgi:hypothetical protein